MRHWVTGINEAESSKAAGSRTSEQQRLLEPEKESKRLRMEVDVLKQAALIIARK